LWRSLRSAWTPGLAAVLLISHALLENSEFLQLVRSENGLDFGSAGLPNLQHFLLLFL
jgi:hypothetical protein